ncbi:MAG: protein-L-isoaspartate O-methyltransferase [Ahrensia sp.]
MADNFSELRRAMVDSQVRTTDVTHLPLVEAMLSVPREVFVPVGKRQFAYIDDDILVSDDGQPRYIMEASPFAKMVQLADITQDHLVLDVGCATGYSAAVLSRLAGAVVALEEDEKLAETAAETLSEHGYDNVDVVTGALVGGHADQGPYDVIFVGGAVDYVPDALLSQVKADGRLVVVEGLGLAGVCKLYVRDDEGVVSSRRAFNLSVRPLPGFAKVAEFTF